MFRDPEGKWSAIRVLFFVWAVTVFFFWVVACIQTVIVDKPPKLADIPSSVVQMLAALAAVRGVQVVSERFGRRGS